MLKLTGDMLLDTDADIQQRNQLNGSEANGEAFMPYTQPFPIDKYPYVPPSLGQKPVTLWMLH